MHYHCIRLLTWIPGIKILSPDMCRKSFLRTLGHLSPAQRRFLFSPALPLTNIIEFSKMFWYPGWLFIEEWDGYLMKTKNKHFWCLLFTLPPCQQSDFHFQNTHKRWPIHTKIIRYDSEAPSIWQKVIFNRHCYN